MRGAEARLRNGGGVDQELDAGASPGEQFGLEPGRDIERKCRLAGFQQSAEFAGRDHDGLAKVLLRQHARDAARQFGAVFIGDDDAGVADILRIAGGLHINRSGEGVDDKPEQETVAGEAAQFLQRQSKDDAPIHLSAPACVEAQWKSPTKRARRARAPRARSRDRKSRGPWRKRRC